VARRLLVLVMMAVVAVAALSTLPWSATPGTEATGVTWNLSSDFRVSPNQANPNPDAHGNADVWYFMQGASLVQDPTTYSLLPNFRTNIWEVEGLEEWYGNYFDTTPLVMINATGSTPPPSQVKFPWPPGVVLLHPSPTQLSVVGWKSPISGTVTLSGAFGDYDPNCGNGVVWSIDDGTAPVANGIIPNGGSQDFGPIAESVSEGDFIYFVIDPNGYYACDSTGLDLTISTGGGAAPDFKLPYAKHGTLVAGEPAPLIAWTGGPHALDGTSAEGEMPVAMGSGLDFACSGSGCTSNRGFRVLAIAAGTAEYVNKDCDGTSGDPPIGCFVAVRHKDGSVAVYGHLDPTLSDAPDYSAGVPVYQVGIGANVWPGRLIGIAGNSGTGAHGRVHLHLELRKGEETSTTCVQNDCFGSALSWDGREIDGWRIFEYYKDGEPTKAWNYDGSAVKDDNVEVIPNFAYWDTDDDGIAVIDRCATCGATVVVARVGEAFDQVVFGESSGRCVPSTALDYASATDCEQNAVDPNHTQFAKLGDSPGVLSGAGSAGSAWPPLSAGNLASTNVLQLDPSAGVGGITSLTGAARAEERRPAGRAGGWLIAALAGAGVAGAAGAVWFARRRVGRRA
jgi:murein DD-endopeptidase MepM/ murein hydrolase activator NlpD